VKCFRGKRIGGYGGIQRSLVEAGTKAPVKKKTDLVALGGEIGEAGREKKAVSRGGEKRGSLD